MDFGKLNRTVVRKSTGPKKQRKLLESNASKSEIKRLAKRIQAVSSELKYASNVNATYTSISYNGTDFLNPLTLVPQGDSDSNRDGDALKLHSIQVVFAWKVSTTTPSFVRMCIFQWKPNSVPVYANVFIDQHNTTLAPFTYYNHDLRHQFVILFDEVVEIDTISHPAHLVKKIIMKGFNPNLQFSAGGTTSTNHIYAFACSDVNAAGPQLVFHSKITYYDG
jgi:hypothetical protein